MLYVFFSGLFVVQMDLNIISNNIVNVNMFGFKELCVEFGDVYFILFFINVKMILG